jgi:hypothetical protein
VSNLFAEQYKNFVLLREDRMKSCLTSTMIAAVPASALRCIGALPLPGGSAESA